LTDSEFKERPTLAVPVERSEWNLDFTAVRAEIEATAPKGMLVDAINFPRDPDKTIRFRLLYRWATRPASWAFVDPRDGTILDFHHHWDYPTGHLIH